MKRLLVLCFFSCLFAQASVAQEYDVFLLIGQSNMAGRGWMLDQDRQVFDENVFLLDDKGEPVPATNPLNQYSTIRKTLSMQQICPGYGFSKKISEATGRKILLVVNARGGTKIQQWMKGADDRFFEEAVERARLAMQYGELKAILWHQGCGNSGEADIYMDSLSVFVSDLREALGVQVPFVAGELGQWRPNVAEFNQMISTISSCIPNSDYVSSKGCKPIVTSRSEGEPDMKDPHFDRDSQLLLGKRYAKKILKMCY